MLKNEITTPKAQFMKETIDKLDFIKVKNFCSEKDNVKKMRRLATDREKKFCENIKNCYPKYIKNV